MPQKAANESQQCCAFNARDKRRCRLQKEENKKTCEIHKNYYKNWIDKYKRYLALGINYMSPRERVEFIFQISNKHVEITEKDILMLNRENTGFYRLFMKYTDHSPLMNYACLNEVVLQEMDRVTTQSFLHRHMKHMLKDVNSVFVVLYILQRNLIYKSLGSIENYFELLTHFMSAENCRQILYSSFMFDVFEKNKEFIRSHASYFPELYIDGLWNAEDGLLYKWTRAFNKLHSKSIVDRMNIYKEELMAIAWHPKRVEAWLEAGVDIEDM